MLRSDLVGYRVRPVSSIDAVAQYDAEVLAHDDEVCYFSFSFSFSFLLFTMNLLLISLFQLLQLQTLILINFGGTTNVRELFKHTQSDTGIFIFDSRRPVHRANVEDPNVCYFVNFNKLNSLGTNEKVVVVGCSEEEAEENYNESPESDDDDDDDDDDEYDEDDESILFQVFPCFNIIPTTVRPAKRKRIAKNKSVQTGTFYGKSSSFVAFEMARDLSKTSEIHLAWCAIVGCTEQYLNRKISKEKYNEGKYWIFFIFFFHFFFHQITFLFRNVLV